MPRPSDRKYLILQRICCLRSKGQALLMPKVSINGQNEQIFQKYPLLERCNHLTVVSPGTELRRDITSFVLQKGEAGAYEPRNPPFGQPTGAFPRSNRHCASSERLRPFIRRILESISPGTLISGSREKRSSAWLIRTIS